MVESPPIDHPTAGGPLNITVSNIAPDTVVCVVTGDIDLSTGSLLQDKLIKAVGAAPRHLVIDLSEVEFLGSTGLKILLDLRATQQGSGRQLILIVGGNRMVMRPLQVTGLEREFDLYADLATALEACRPAENVAEDTGEPPTHR